MFGNNQYKNLKELRQKIADENDISYVTSECSDPCAKSERPDRRHRLGKALVVTALCAGMCLAITACDPKDKSATPTPASESGVQAVTPGEMPNPELVDEFEDSTEQGTTEGNGGAASDAEATTGETTNPDPSSGGKTPVPTESESYDPSEGLPIVLPPDEFG